jgi:hypothetical protein
MSSMRACALTENPSTYSYERGNSGNLIGIGRRTCRGVRGRYAANAPSGAEGSGAVGARVGSWTGITARPRKKPRPRYTPMPNVRIVSGVSRRVAIQVMPVDVLQREGQRGVGYAPPRSLRPVPRGALAWRRSSPEAEGPPRAGSNLP